MVTVYGYRHIYQQRLAEAKIRPLEEDYPPELSEGYAPN
jgi:hypothetical protein